MVRYRANTTPHNGVGHFCDHFVDVNKMVGPAHPPLFW